MMGENRIRELLRDPTLDQPALDYFEVRLPWQSFAVRQEAAERILEAMLGHERAEWVRAETVTGSVVHIRTEHVVFVREWSQAQRDTERRFWKQIDKEYEEDENPPSDAPPQGEGQSEPGAAEPQGEAGSDRVSTRTTVMVSANRALVVAAAALVLSHLIVRLVIG
ncbi:MAG: hypothetical protein JSU98_12000 [Gemmatimonadales bacterium]|jgi:hypothetical protein|nr:MAG: hypothetical protein JSU98_12000 [Gemmatimonadales bacterium]